MSSLALRPTQPPSQWTMGLFPGDKVMVHADYQSPPSNADIKSEWSYTCAPLHAFMAWAGTILSSIFASVLLHLLFMVMSKVKATH